MARMDSQQATPSASHIADQLPLDAVMIFPTAVTPIIDTGTIITGAIIRIGGQGGNVAYHLPPKA